MKLFALFALLAISGCANYNTAARWNDMWTDLYLMHKYDKRGGCGCPQHGYAK